MLEKYDLEAMLKEIEKDETAGTGAAKKLSQDDIKKMIAKKMAGKKESAQ